MTLLAEHGLWLRLVAAVLLLAVLVGPLGCFIVWRRMAYFGDALAHGALIGAGLGMALALHPSWSMFAFAAAFAWLLTQLRQRTPLSQDVLIGVVMHACLGLGLLGLGLTVDEHELHDLLFGDVLQIGWGQLGALAAAAAVSSGLIIWQWPKLVLWALDENLAQGEGVGARRQEYFVSLLAALTIALALQIMGVLLIIAMLILPASAASLIARTPEAMGGLASAAAAAAGLGGLALHRAFALAPAPAMVSVAAALFVLAFLARAR